MINDTGIGLMVYREAYYILVVFPAGTKPRETIDTTTEDGQ